MNDVIAGVLRAGGLGVAAIIVSVGPGWAGVGAPAPLVGVTGPFGLLAAGAAYGGYLLFKRFGKHG